MCLGLSACVGLDPAVKASVVWPVDRPGAFVFGDGQLSCRRFSSVTVRSARRSSRRRRVTRCWGVLDWNARPHVIVSTRWTWFGSRSWCLVRGSIGRWLSPSSRRCSPVRPWSEMSGCCGGVRCWAGCGGAVSRCSVAAAGRGGVGAVRGVCAEHQARCAAGAAPQGAVPDRGGYTGARVPPRRLRTTRLTNRGCRPSRRASAAVRSEGSQPL